MPFDVEFLTASLASSSLHYVTIARARACVRACVCVRVRVCVRVHKCNEEHIILTIASYSLLQFPCGTERKVSAKCKVSSGADGSYVFYSVPVGQYTLVSSVHSTFVCMYICVCVCVCVTV